MPFNYVDTLLYNLNYSEKKSVIHHFSKNTSPENSLLRKYIMSRLDGVDKDCPTKNENRMLKSRAFSQVTDILISDYHLDNKANFPFNDQLLFQLKKRMLLVRIISKSLDQNRMGPFKTLLNIIITDAKKNELYEILVEALYLKKYVFALKEGDREFQKIEKEIKYYEACQRKVYYASDCYFRVIINKNLHKSKNENAFLTYLLKIIRLIKADFQKYKSSQINYYLLIITMYYYEKKKKYSLAAKYCKILVSIVQHTPAIYREERIGFALVNLSQYKTFTQNFNEAAKYVKQAQGHYISSSNNYITSKEQEFTIYYYHKKYDKAFACVKELLTHKLVDSGNFTQAKYTYFQSVLLFEQKKYKSALNLLSKSLEIEKDKSGWNISLRIMSIMLNIELHELDESSRLLEALKKYITRVQKKTEVRPRDILIVKLLHEIEKVGFVYKPKNASANKILKELSEKNKPWSWEYYTPEFIPFHEWLVTREN